MMIMRMVAYGDGDDPNNNTDGHGDRDDKGGDDGNDK